MKQALLFICMIAMLMPGFQVLAWDSNPQAGIVDEQISLADSTAREFDAAMRDDLDAYVTDALERFGIVGASVAVVQHGETVYSNGFGTTELNGGQPVDSQTLFMIGSVTKSMTSLVMATLVDEGAVTWDTPVTDVLPTFALSDPAATAQIRIRDLLNMSSGVPSYDVPLFFKVFSPIDAIEYLPQIPLVAQPGEQFNYSNFMVAIGGYAAAIASGAPYDDSLDDVYIKLVQDRVFDPLNMTASTFDFDAAMAQENRAASYSVDFLTGETIPVPVDFERFVGSVPAAGAVWSNAEDMAQYLAMEQRHGLTSDGSRIVSEKNLLITQTPDLSDPEGSGAGYGMGWFINHYQGMNLITHGGGTIGQVCTFSFLPDAELGVVVLSNHILGDNFVNAVREYVFELVFGLEHTADAQYYGWQAETFESIEQLSSQITLNPVQAEDVADFVGDYELGISFALSPDGELVAQTAFGDPLYFLAIDGEDGRFVSNSALSLVSLRFEVDDSGQVTALLSSFFDEMEGVSPGRFAKIN